jgi:hypothetical protein
MEVVVKRFGMEDSKPTGTPLDTKVKFVKLSNEEYDADAWRMGSLPYKSAVGLLMYAILEIRADLAFAISNTWQGWGSIIEEDHEIPQGTSTRLL